MNQALECGNSQTNHSLALRCTKPPTNVPSSIHMPANSQTSPCIPYRPVTSNFLATLVLQLSSQLYFHVHEYRASLSSFLNHARLARDYPRASRDALPRALRPCMHAYLRCYVPTKSPSPFSDKFELPCIPIIPAMHPSISCRANGRQYHH